MEVADGKRTESHRVDDIPKPRGIESIDLLYSWLVDCMRSGTVLELAISHVSEQWGRYTAPTFIMKSTLMAQPPVPERKKE